MKYDALIEIEAEPYNCHYQAPDGKEYFDNGEEITNAIAKYIQDAFKSPDKTSELLEKLHDSIERSKNNVSVKISEVQHSGVTGISAVSTLKDLAKDFDEFRKKAEQTPSSNFERLYTTLIRYREIENVKKIIPEELPITVQHYKMIRNLNKTIYFTRCYKSAVDSIPAAHLIDGEARRQEWDKEFSDVFNLYNNQLNKLCSDIEFVREYYIKFNSLLEKYQGINHRYVFYRRLRARQRTISNPGDWEDSDDNDSYPRFKAGFTDNEIATNKFVKKDLSEGYYSSEINLKADKWTSLSDSEKERKGSFPADARPYYYEGGTIDTNSSKAKDLKVNTLGKRSYDWQFDRGGFRRVEIKINFKLMDMPVSKYPFVGLED